MTIAANNLPNPSVAHDIEDRPRRITPSWSQTVLRAIPDDHLRPRRWLLGWDNVPRAVAVAIREHYAAHRWATWSWTVPRTGEVVFVRWLSPPAISWRTATSASATAELGQALAVET